MKQQSKRVCLRSFTYVLGLLVLISSLVSCAPRGETKSLDEVFAIAKQRYEEGIVGAKLSDPTKEKLIQLSSNLEAFLVAASPSEAGELSREISDDLTALIASAGYTTRPAFGELLKTYQGVAAPKDRAGTVSVESAEAPEGNFALDDSARKLLVARSFTALAQELETTSFRVVKAGV